MSRTYHESGVDSAAADRHVENIAKDVVSTWGPDIVGEFGGFAAGFTIPEGYQEPVVMMTTDGVGTKAEIARLAGRYHGIGQDLVAMIADDLVAVGATPVAVTDYLVVGAADPERDVAIVSSVAAACRQVGCALLGGETAQHPGTMDVARFDLAGTAAGVVERGSEITGRAIAPGDELVAIASPNLRCNGFSLIRSAFLPGIELDWPFPGMEASVADVLLEPSVLYTPAVLEAVAAGGVHGMAHVTGGGIAGNLVRVLPDGCSAIVDRSTWKPPHVFTTVAEVARIATDEMFATFNMGVGFILVVDRAAAADVTALLGNSGHETWRLGEIVEGTRAVEFAGP